MQIRCQTLDKKSQVSDHEINTLTEEKIRLQSQVEAFEVQVEELVKSRDEAQKQTTANGAQYMRIMSMSSKLQIQGAEEAKRYKQEREGWERDREGLQRRIEDLEAGRSTSAVPGDAKMDPKAAPDSDDILTSASLDVLRNEVVRLRQSLLSMERAFHDVQQERETIDHVIIECTGIRDRLSAKTLSSEHIMAVSTGSPDGDTKMTPIVMEMTEAEVEAEAEAVPELDTRSTPAREQSATEPEGKATPTVTEVMETEATPVAPAAGEVTMVMIAPEADTVSAPTPMGAAVAAAATPDPDQPTEG
jgi:chromosome segregation ATPase